MMSGQLGWLAVARIWRVPRVLVVKNIAQASLIDSLPASLANIEVLPLVGGLACHAFGALRIQLRTIKSHGMPNAQKSERLRRPEFSAQGAAPSGPQPH